MDESKVSHYIELRGVYDGWSIAVMQDGRMVNRWPADDPRHKPTQDAIDRMNADGTGG